MVVCFVVFGVATTHTQPTLCVGTLRPSGSPLLLALPSSRLAVFLSASMSFVFESGVPHPPCFFCVCSPHLTSTPCCYVALGTRGNACKPVRPSAGRVAVRQAGYRRCCGSRRDGLHDDVRLRKGCRCSHAVEVQCLTQHLCFLLVAVLC